MKNSAESFFQNIIEKLSILNADISKNEFLKDVCEFFDISHAFIYEINHSGVFQRKEYFEVTQRNPLNEIVDIKAALGSELFSELCSKRVIVCSGEIKKTPLEEKLKEIFNISTIVFIPILNQHFEIAGFVGLGDRRKRARHAQADINQACALLTLLANGVKLEMFSKGIENTEAALANVLDHTGIDIYVNDYYTHDVLYANKSMAEPYGGVDNMVGKKCWATIFNDKSGPCDFCPQPKLLDEDGELNKTYQWDYERPFDRSWFRVLSSSFPWMDGRIAHLVASVDITESKKNQLLIEKIAQYDHLTGLANRRKLHEDVHLFIDDHSKFGGKWYVLFCDLDGFKNINDTLGHAAGDALLIGIAEDLINLCTEDMRAYRQGGDEFVLIVKDNDSPEFLVELLNKLTKLFNKNHDFNGNKMHCGCSIGVAHYPKDTITAKEIFHLADTAMYRVKKEERGAVRFCHKGQFLSITEYFQNK